MTRIKSTLILLLGIFAILHSLYPPRIAESSANNKRTRAFIFSDDFYIVDLNQEISPKSTNSTGPITMSYYNEAKFDTIRYQVILVTGLGIFLILFGTLSILQKPTIITSKLPKNQYNETIANG